MTARERKRQQMHNASAMRSRVRLNEMVENLWRTIPPVNRRKGSRCTTPADAEEDGKELEERMGRADKIEIGIKYITHLQDRMKQLEGLLNIADDRQAVNYLNPAVSPLHDDGVTLVLRH
jgi:hypothetical protein